MGPKVHWGRCGQRQRISEANIYNYTSLIVLSILGIDSLFFKTCISAESELYLYVELCDTLPLLLAGIYFNKNFPEHKVPRSRRSCWTFCAAQNILRTCWPYWLQSRPSGFVLDPILATRWRQLKIQHFK